MARWGRRIVLVGGGAAAGALYFLPFDSAIRRTARTVTAVGLTALDYKLLQWRKLADEPEQLAAAHRRNAARMERLCAQQGGLFTKFGQHVSAVGTTIPVEYRDALAALQDKAPTHSFADVQKTFQEEFGTDLDAVFIDFDPTPIASASLAQVHKGTLKETGELVAVKVQHPRVRETIPEDLWLLHLLASRALPFFFEGVDLGWIVDEFRRNLAMELDFRIEAQSGEKAARLFTNANIKVPKVYPTWSSERVLTMEFANGSNLRDLAAHLPAVSAMRVATVLTEVFAQMIFVDGFVHGDPHMGNLLVAADPHAPDGFVLILLDHGLYRTVDEKFRLGFCRLWQSLVTRNVEGIKEAVAELGMPDFGDLFSMMLVQRPVSSLQRTSTDMRRPMTKEERMEFRRKHGGDFDREKMTQTMEALPKDLFIIMRTTNLIKAINHDIGADNVNRFAINARYAVRGLHHNNDTSLLPLWRDTVRLEATMLALNLGLRYYQIMSAFRSLFEQKIKPPEETALVAT